jgi:hypothetical protein
MERLGNIRSYIKIQTPSYMKDFLVDVYPFLDCTYCSETYMTFKIYVTIHDIRRIKITKLQGGELDERSIKITKFFSYYGKHITFLNLDKYIPPSRGKIWD